jgi:dipeptidyl aminopeptidase/acylaminoacyl peptidase
MIAGRRRPDFSLAALVSSLLLLAAAGSSHGAVPASRAQAGGLTIDHLLSIAHPGPPVWSPSGERIAFLRELDGGLDLWWTAEGRERAVAVTHEADSTSPAAVSGYVWTSSGDALVYALRGDLFLHHVESGSTELLLESAADESAPALSADGRRIAFLQDGRPWVGTFPELAGGPVIDSDESFQSLQWSPDGSHLVAAYGRSETVFEDTGALMGGKMGFSRRDTVSSGLAVIDLTTGRLHGLESGDDHSSQPAFSPSGMLAWQEVSADAKRRRIVVAAAPDWAPRVVVDESDAAWWTLTYMEAGPRWSPTDDRFVFVSERDGWAHAYLVDVEQPDAAIVQLTAGDFEVEEPAWSPDGRTLVLSANKGSSSERGLQLVDVASAGQGGAPELEPISRLRGTSIYGRWRPDGGAIAFLHADPENPLDVWVQEPGPQVARQLSDTWPDEADESELVRPQRVRFSSTDGELIPAQLFLPPDYDDLEGPLPAVVWVHGGGIRQNRYGWHPRRAYAVFFGFHQYLLQRGYAVVTVDYRGSIGYGREFRQGPYLDLGGIDLDDVLGTTRYLRRLEEVEIGRIGVWGISYGGFLTLQALVQAPGAFDAGVDVAGVADWADWAVDPGGLWIEGRMGPVAENPELYRRSSPIHSIGRLSRPLMILHGTADRSVPVLQAFKLTDALVRADKPFDVTIYPGEEHAFVRTHTWRDAFARVEAFFDTHLRGREGAR